MSIPAPKAEAPTAPQFIPPPPVEEVAPETAIREDQRRDDYDTNAPDANDVADYPPHDEDHPVYKDEDQMEEHPHILSEDDHEEDDEDDEEGDSPHRSRRRQRRPRSRMRVARPKPPIQEIFRRGQEVLVQVIKEGLGTKGPTLSTYISIPGRYLVLMPGLNRIGVSRKIPDDEQRKKLRDFLQDLKPPQGLGFIIRTAGLDRTKRELHRDLAYLTRLWKVVIRRIKKSKSPTMIYQESDIITRTIRDVFTSEIETIRVDEPAAFEHAQEFLQVVMPRYAERLVLDIEQDPFFHRYGLESEIARIQQRRLPLPQGGSIVIEQTEALVAIDVNSGNFRQDNDAEETAFRVNLTAAKEIARQLRLRDMGGVIIIDFIDMRDEHHRRELERTLRDAVKRDRARTKILKMSQFGIVEMTRQRIRPSLKRSSFEDCSHCRGNGQVKTAESMSIEVMRWLQLAAHRNVNRIQVRVTEAVSQYLLNRKRKEIAQLEETGKMSVTVFGSPHAPPEMLEFTCYDSNGGEIKLAYPDTPPARGGRGGRRSDDRDRERR
jgi:ribonuclease E